MLNLHKILLPVLLDEEFTATSRQVAIEAAWLARRFDAEVVLLHVVPPFSYPAGIFESGHEITARDLHSHIVQHAEQSLDRALRSELQGIPVTRVLLRGDPAREIVATAQDHNADLIMLCTHGYAAAYRYLLGSVTAKVLHESPCAVWTVAYPHDSAGASGAPASPSEFSIHHVLCSVDLSAHSRSTVTQAAAFAEAAGASLTLAHITPGTTRYGPGGSHVDLQLQKVLADFAAEEIAGLQKELGTTAAVVIESGTVAQHLGNIISETKADVLLLGHNPGRGHLGDNGEGYEIIRASTVPVLSV